MKVIGLLGGMSWESTVSYYQIINRVVGNKLGGLNSAKCVLYSVNFQEIEACQAKGEWDKSAEILIDGAKRLENAGADFIVLCTNTMHKVLNTIQAQVDIPMIHIAEVMATHLQAKNITKIGLLGTKYTMEQDFYKQRLIENGIEVVIPDEASRNEVNRVIYQELCKGEINQISKQAYLHIIDKLSEQGVQGVILGCTEIGLLVNQNDTHIPLFDTAYIHAEYAALLALKS